MFSDNYQIKNIFWSFITIHSLQHMRSMVCSEDFCLIILIPLLNSIWGQKLKRWNIIGFFILNRILLQNSYYFFSASMSRQLTILFINIDISCSGNIWFWIFCTYNISYIFGPELLDLTYKQNLTILHKLLLLHINFWIYTIFGNLFLSLLSLREPFTMINTNHYSVSFIWRVIQYVSSNFKCKYPLNK